MGLPIEPYDPYGPGKGYDVITDDGDASPDTGDASPKVWMRTTKKATHRRRSNATRTPPVSLDKVIERIATSDRVTLVIEIRNVSRRRRLQESSAGTTNGTRRSSPMAPMRRASAAT